MRILVINPGSTSTKTAVFEDEEIIFAYTLRHSMKVLSRYKNACEQYEMRKICIEALLSKNNYKLSDFDAVCGRGGFLPPMPSGTYLITDETTEFIRNNARYDHAANLGTLLAKGIADEAGIPAFFTDPVTVDEFGPLAKISGYAGIERECFSHALNQKSVAYRAAEILSKPYEECNLIVCHLGGGISVVAHEKGLMTDNTCSNYDGCFSVNRAGNLPTAGLIDLCFSGKTKEEVTKILSSEAGIFSYLGTDDFTQVERNIFYGDKKSMLIFDAFIYQLCKDIGAMASVLKFNVDSIVLTGGIANSPGVCNAVKERAGKLARVLELPGEREMQSLAEGTLRVLRKRAADALKAF